MHPAQILIACSAAIVGVLGTIHLIYTFRGQRFEPRDPDLLQRMQQVSPRITRETTLWRAGLGFHASHSLGAMLFASVYLYLALEPQRFLLQSAVLLALGMLYLLAMLLLARLYWFRVPLLGVSVATVSYAAALLSLSLS